LRRTPAPVRCRPRVAFFFGQVTVSGEKYRHPPPGHGRWVSVCKTVTHVFKLTVSYPTVKTIPNGLSCHGLVNKNKKINLKIILIELPNVPNYQIHVSKPKRNEYRQGKIHYIIFKNVNKVKIAIHSCIYYSCYPYRGPFYVGNWNKTVSEKWKT